jgi:hypothetical protein
MFQGLTTMSRRVKGLELEISRYQVVVKDIEPKVRYPRETGLYTYERSL